MPMVPWWVTAVVGWRLLWQGDPVVGAMVVGAGVGAFVGVYGCAVGCAMAVITFPFLLVYQITSLNIRPSFTPPKGYFPALSS